MSDIECIGCIYISLMSSNIQNNQCKKKTIFLVTTRLEMIGLNSIKNFIHQFNIKISFVVILYNL